VQFIRDVWPVVSFIANLLFIIIGALGLRWIAGIVEALKQEITIAILRVEKMLAEEYVKRSDLDKLAADLRREINLVGRIDSGFSRLNGGQS
jgi:hypothetical protein